MRRLLYSEFWPGRPSLALLGLRVVAGLAFMAHGWPKVSDPAAFAAGTQLPLFLAMVAAWTELVGGALLILGLLTPVAAAFIGFEMLVALFKVHLPAGHPFVNPNGHSYELALLYLAIMFAFVVLGAGAYSADAWLARRLALVGEVPPVARRRGTV